MRKIIGVLLLSFFIFSCDVHIEENIENDHNIIVSLISDTFTNCLLEGKMQVWKENQWREAKCDKVVSYDFTKIANSLVDSKQFKIHGDSPWQDQALSFNIFLDEIPTPSRISETICNYLKSKNNVVCVSRLGSNENDYKTTYINSAY